MVKSILMIILLSAFVFSTFGDDPKWTQIPGQFSAVSTKGQEVWALSNDDINSTIYRYKNNQLQVIPQILQDKSYINGYPSFIAAAQDGWAWMVIKNFVGNSSLYRWNAVQSFWEFMPTDRPPLYVNAFSKDSAIATFVTDQSSGILVYKNGVWEKVPSLPDGTPALVVAIGENGDRWVTEFVNGNIYHWNSMANRWDMMPGKCFFGLLDVENSERVIMESGGSVSIWTANIKNWTLITIPSAGALGVSINRDSAYYVDNQGRLFTAKI